MGNDTDPTSCTALTNAVSGAMLHALPNRADSTSNLKPEEAVSKEAGLDRFHEKQIKV